MAENEAGSARRFVAHSAETAVSIVIPSGLATIPRDATSHQSADPLRLGVSLVLGAAGLGLAVVRALVEPSTTRSTAVDDQRPPTAPQSAQTMDRFAVAAVGLGVEAQRRCLNAAAAVGSPIAAALSSTIVTTTSRRPLAAIGRRLSRWSDEGLAEQRRNEELTIASGRAMIRAVVAAVLAEVDLDAVVDRVDLDRIIDRLDLNEISERIDLDAIASRIDLDVLVDQVDLDRIIDRIDLNEISERIDLDAIATRIDIDAIASRIDLDAVATQLDVNAIVLRVDLARVTEQVLDEVDVGHIVRESSGAMAAETVDALRLQSMRADRFLGRVVDRILFRTSGRDTGAFLSPDPPVAPDIASMDRR